MHTYYELVQITLLIKYPSFNENVGINKILVTLCEFSRSFGSFLRFKECSNRTLRFWPAGRFAGNKFDLYGMILSHENFDHLREFEFYYDSCLRFSSLDFGAGQGTISAFGGSVLSQCQNPRYPLPGALKVDHAPLPRKSGLPIHYIRHPSLYYVDGFVFFHSCWMNLNERGRSVVFTKPLLDSKTQRLIEEHAISLGHHRDKIVFSRRKTYNDGGGSITTTISPYPGGYPGDRRRGSWHGRRRG